MSSSTDRELTAHEKLVAATMAMKDGYTPSGKPVHFDLAATKAHLSSIEYNREIKLGQQRAREQVAGKRFWG